MAVKLSDLIDNSDISRIKNPTEKDYARTEKYLKAIKRIREKQSLLVGLEIVRSLGCCNMIDRACIVNTLNSLEKYKEATQIKNMSPYEFMTFLAEDLSAYLEYKKLN